MIILTGAGGFIGSVILKHLNDRGITDIVIIDDLPNPVQYKNLINKKFLKLMSTQDDLSFIQHADFVIHFGANANTIETDWSRIYKENVLSTRRHFEFSKKIGAKFIFASSAAVYGDTNGPLNQYAFSKLISERELEDSVILRLFNVYGPNEYHKQRMSSTIFHWFNQLKANGHLKLFEESKISFRDFIYVDDVAEIVCRCLNNFVPGTYDIGTKICTDFETIANICIEAYGEGEKIYIPMPDDLKDQYQFHTQAKNNTLIGDYGFVCVREGIQKYFYYLKENLRS